MDRQAVLSLFDQEQRIDIEFPNTTKESLPGLVRFTRPAPGANFISYSKLNETNVDAVIQAQIDHFRPLGQFFEWKVYDHDSPADLKDRLINHGFEADEPASVMVLDLKNAPASLLQPVTADVRPIKTRDQLDDVIRTLEPVWGRNFDWIRERLGDHLAIPGYLSIYVAYVDDQPASCGWIYFHPHSQFADIWAGSTIPAYRERGLYTAILKTRVQEAILRGYRFLTIYASPMSEPIVAKHGFQLLTQLYDMELKVSPA
jgi:hypothetical protein